MDSRLTSEGGLRAPGKAMEEPRMCAFGLVY